MPQVLEKLLQVFNPQDAHGSPRRVKGPKDPGLPWPEAGGRRLAAWNDRAQLGCRFWAPSDFFLIFQVMDGSRITGTQRIDDSISFWIQWYPIVTWSISGINDPKRKYCWEQCWLYESENVTQWNDIGVYVPKGGIKHVDHMNTSYPIMFFSSRF